MHHTALEKLCTLAGVFSEADGGRCAKILGTYQPPKLGRRDRTPGNPVGDIAVIEIPHNVPIRVPRSRIPYPWIFEGASKEEVGF